MKTNVLLLTISILIGMHANVRALSLGDLSSINNDTIKKLHERLSALSAFKILNPTKPLGLTLGVDAGFEAGIMKMDKKEIGLPDSFDLPKYFGLPRLYLAKGLPFNIDFMFSFLPDIANKNLSSYSGAVKWTVWDTIVDAAVWGSYSTTKITTAYKSSSYEFALQAGKTLMMLSGYAGLGYIKSSGELDQTITKLPVSLDNKPKADLFHFYGGVAMKMLFMNLAFELDYIKVPVYVGKLSLKF